MQQQNRETYNSFQVDPLAGGLGFLFQFLILGHTVQEILTALGLLHVLHSHIDALWNNAASGRNKSRKYERGSAQLTILHKDYKHCFQKSFTQYLD
jgi:hypothetical protein